VPVPHRVHPLVRLQVSVHLVVCQPLPRLVVRLVLRYHLLVRPRHPHRHRRVVQPPLRLPRQLLFHRVRLFHLHQVVLAHHLALVLVVQYHLQLVHRLRFHPVVQHPVPRVLAPVSVLRPVLQALLALVLAFHRRLVHQPACHPQVQLVPQLRHRHLPVPRVAPRPVLARRVRYRRQVLRVPQLARVRRFRRVRLLVPASRRVLALRPAPVQLLPVRLMLFQPPNK